MRPATSATAVALAALLALLASPLMAQTRLLRFPDIHGDQVVFTYAGDLWLAPVAGGSARRLTAHPGLELFAKFSPDGRSIAFTGQYDGDEQVYVMPVEGGVPRQLTYYPARGPLPPRWGYDNQVYGWTPDGRSVLFRSMRDGWDLSDTRLYTVDAAGGLPVALPMPVSGAGDLAPNGQQVVYSPLVRDFRHWKRYQGGWAQDLYIFDLATFEARNITHDPRSDRDPMWVGDHIYFASDRTGTLNLYAYDPATDQTEQLTHSTVWDVRWPSADETGRIVYELDGELHVFDAGDRSDRAISIFVPDDGVNSRPSRISAEHNIEGFGLSPKGERALFTARGDVFSAPIENGLTRNLTRSSGAHDREATWSPDGRQVAFVSDRDGEEQIYLVGQDDGEPPRQLTTGGTGQKFDLLFSPDGKRLAYHDQGGRLYLLEIASRQVRQVADDPAAFGLTYSFSPDSAHLAFSLQDENTLRSIYLWSAADGQVRRVTGGLFNEYEPVWDPEGNYLYYLSDREFHPQLGAFEFNYVINRATSLYAMALRRDVANPFPPKSDEVAVEEEKPAAEGAEAGKETKGDKSAKGGKDEAEKAAAPKPVRIDYDGLAQRVTRVPVEADNYTGLAAVKGHLLYARVPAPYYGRDGEGGVELRIYAIADRKETTLAEDISGYALSADGSKVLVQSQGAYTRYDATPGGKDSAKKVATAGLQVDRVPAEEWAQIFDEVWRRFRDYFYVENMNGYDWAALRDRYRPLLAHVAHRSDLNYVLSEMIGELNNSHTYIAGGDFDLPERPHAALLGARLELDAAAGRFRVARILGGQNEEPSYRSPLTEVGVDVKVGDYLLAINGQDFGAGDNPYRILRNAGGSPVELTVSDTAAGERRKVTIDPISSESDLIYLAWIEGNRRKVDEATGGRVGYIHIPDMGGDGIREFIKGYYSQIRRQGLVLDVRSNGGGNVSSMIIERLQRKLLMLDYERNVDYPDTYPSAVFHGHMACLLDEDTASDGDQFAYVFRVAGLGPLIGKRSWGGVVGIYGRGPLIDGGSVFVPEAGSADPQGNWVVEGHGVDPDIVVENEPKEVLAGRDPQLEKAIEVVLAKIEQEPMTLPPRPADPVKTH